MLRCLGFALIAIAAPIASMTQPTVSDRVTLTVASHGIAGELQLLQDATHATLRVVRSDGSIADAADLERPHAQLAHARLYGDAARETYLVTVDYSVGAGSYAGPITSFVEVIDGRLKWLDAADGTTGATERIHVMRSLKTIWQIAPARAGAGQDILEARCRPAPQSAQAGEVQFTLSYYRYAFDRSRNQWIRRVREEKGFSEFEDGFPDRRLFP